MNLAVPGHSPASAPVCHVLSFIACHRDTTPKNSDLREKGLTLAHKPRSHSIMTEKSQQQALKHGHVYSQEQRAMN